MLNRKILLIPTLALTVLLAASCDAAPDISNEDALLAAVQEGVLLQMDQVMSQDEIYDVAEAFVMDMARDFEGTVRFFAPHSRDLYFQRSNGRLVNTYVGTNQWVEEGQLLAEVEFDREPLIAEREQIQIRLAQYELQYANDEARILNGIDRMRNALAGDMSDNETEVHLLRIAKAELEYEQFVYRSNATRDSYLKQLSDIDERLNGEQIYAPFSGYVRYINTARPGTIIYAWNRIVTVDSDSSVQMAVDGAIENFRFDDVFMVTDYRNPDFFFEVRVVSDPIVTDTRLGQYTYLLEPTDLGALAEAMEANDYSLSLLFSLNLSAVPQAYDIRNALMLPRAAVKMDEGKNYVTLFEDGRLKKRFVVTGLTLGNDMQILDGLTEGQKVVIIP